MIQKTFSLALAFALVGNTCSAIGMAQSPVVPITPAIRHASIATQAINAPALPYLRPLVGHGSLAPLTVEEMKRSDFIHQVQSRATFREQI